MCEDMKYLVKETQNLRQNILCIMFFFEIRTNHFKLKSNLKEMDVSKANFKWKHISVYHNL